MNDDKQSEIDKSLEGLHAFKKRLTQYAMDLLVSGDNDTLTPTLIIAIEKVKRIADYIDYISVEIVDGEGGRGKAVALAVLNVLLLDVEFFFRVAMDGLSDGSVFIEENKRRMEHIRSFIDRPKASFNDDIVASVFQEHVDVNGPWNGRASILAHKLKPEIDRRAVDGGGKPLKEDTITRRLKSLMAPTQH